VRYLEWVWDPDPTDEEALSEFAFVLRETNGATSVEHETHRWGLFTRATWLRLLQEAGFEASSVFEETPEDRPMRELFLGRRPR